MIRLQCDCGRKIAAPDQWLGKRVKCPQCGKPVTVRAADGPGAPADAPPERPAAVAVAPAPPGRAAGKVPAASKVDRQATVPSPEAEPAAPQALPREAGDLPFESHAPAEPPGDAVQAPIASGVAPPSSPAEPAPAQPDSPRRQLAPAPSVNATTPKITPEEQAALEVKRRRLPRFVGTLAVLVAAAGSAANWAPAPCKAWAMQVAVGGLVLAVAAIAIAASRRGLGIGVPLLALIVALAAVGTPRAIPLLNGGRSGSPRSTTLSDAGEQGPDEAQRRRILAVDSLRLVSHGEGPVSDIEYKLTNKSGKAINAVTGSVRLYGNGHRALGGLGLSVAQPIAPGASVSGTNTWTLDDDARAALAGGVATAEYRADAVVFADGSEETFAK